MSKRKAGKSRAERPSPKAPLVDYTKIPIMTTYRWKGYQRENAIHLYFEKRIPLAQVADLIGVPFWSLRWMMDESPRKKKLYHWKRKKHIPEEWRERTK